MKFYLIQKYASARLHCALALLMLVLQRSPALKLLLNAKHLQGGSPVARILQTLSLPSATLATPHAVSGASTSSYVVEYINTPELKVGVEAVIKFENTITPQSWTLEDELPPGMRVTDLRLRKSVVDGVIATDIGIITGTPSQAGIYDIVLTPWSNDDGTGDTAPEPDPGALRLSLTVLPDESLPVLAPDIVFTQQNNTITLTWQTAAAEGFQLKESSDLRTWESISHAPTMSNGEARLSLPLSNSAPRFYRLEPAN